MIKILQSFLFSAGLIFKKKNIDIVFYCSQHFNRGETGQNLYFEHLLKACENNKISYMVFEEPEYNYSKPRSSDAVPFDFIFYLIIFFRKLNLSDKYIGILFSATFLRGLRFKNYIVLSQSMLEFFKGINPNAKLFDLQHGLINYNKKHYIKNNRVSNKIEKNNIQILVAGNKFKSILSESDKSGYFYNNVHTIGVSKITCKNHHRSPNKNILVSLQFTEDHSLLQNQKLLKELEEFTSFNKGFSFFIRNHPRFNDEVDLVELNSKINIQFAPLELSDCYKLCSIHLTAYSSMVFECA